MNGASARSSAGERPEQHDEARAGQLGGAGEVHAQRRAELVVLARREVERARLAPAPQLDVGALVRRRRARRRRARWGGRRARASSRRCSSRSRSSPAWMRSLSARDLGHQPAPRRRPGRAALADLAASSALRLRLVLLQLGLQRADARVPLEQRRPPWAAGRGAPAPGRARRAAHAATSGRARQHHTRRCIASREADRSRFSGRAELRSLGRGSSRRRLGGLRLGAPRARPYRTARIEIS